MQNLNNLTNGRPDDNDVDPVLYNMPADDELVSEADSEASDDDEDDNEGQQHPNHDDSVMEDAQGNNRVQNASMQQQQQQNLNHVNQTGPGGQQPQREAAQAPPVQGVTAAQDAAPQHRETQTQARLGLGQGNNNGGGAQQGNNDNRAEMDGEPPLDGYERTNRIGQGAYGIVYRGIQRSTGTTVAIKRIPFAEATPEGGVPCNVIREISLLRELDHPNVVRLLDVNQAQPGELYLVFEFVAHDLKTFMDQHQTSTEVNERVGLQPHVVKNFMRQILEGVGFCHTYRVLHRDLKPHNLLISSDGQQLKLADFGLARLSGLPNGPYTYEVVTLWYRAPELLLGANRYSTSVDMWSIGCIFAEMSTGLPLFPGRSDIDQLFKIFQRRGTPTADIWPNCTRLPYFNAEFPQWRPRPVGDLISCSGGRRGNGGGGMADSPQALDLLEQTLQYDPERRLVCMTALQHPYFFGQ